MDKRGKSLIIGIICTILAIFITSYMVLADVGKQAFTITEKTEYDILENTVYLTIKENLGKDDELWLADAIHEYAKTKKALVAKIDGKWVTAGDPLRWLKATVEFALDREDFGEDFKEYLKSLDLK